MLQLKQFIILKEGNLISEDHDVFSEDKILHVEKYSLHL